MSKLQSTSSYSLMGFVFCCRAKIYGKMLREKVLKMFKTLYKIQIKNNAFAVFNHLLSMIIHIYLRKRSRRRWRTNTRNQHSRKPFTLVKSSLSQLKSKAFSRKLLPLIVWRAVFFSILNFMHWKSERYSLQDSSKTHNKTVVMYSTYMECMLHTSTVWNMEGTKRREQTMNSICGTGINSKHEIYIFCCDFAVLLIWSLIYLQSLWLHLY